MMMIMMKIIMIRKNSHDKKNYNKKIMMIITIIIIIITTTMIIIIIIISAESLCISYNIFGTYRSLDVQFSSVKGQVDEPRIVSCPCAKLKTPSGRGKRKAAWSLQSYSEAEEPDGDLTVRRHEVRGRE